MLAFISLFTFIFFPVVASYGSAQTFHISFLFMLDQKRTQHENIFIFCSLFIRVQNAFSFSFFNGVYQVINYLFKRLFVRINVYSSIFTIFLSNFTPVSITNSKHKKKIKFQTKKKKIYFQTFTCTYFLFPAVTT